MEEAKNFCHYNAPNSLLQNLVPIYSSAFGSLMESDVRTDPQSTFPSTLTGSVAKSQSVSCIWRGLSTGWKLMN